MKTDRIFVLLLVVMLPLSGCFDDAVGDAEGADDESGTTVINNYHNNTTIVYNNTTADVGPEYFVVGGTVDNNTTHVPFVNQDRAYYYPYNFSTTSGQTVYVHHLMMSGGASSISLSSDCGEGGVWTVQHTQTNYQEHHNGYWVAGSAYDCHHSVKMIGGAGVGIVVSASYPPLYFSMVYSIEEMTVMPL